MAEFAGLRKAAANVVRILRPLEISQVAGDACGDRNVVVPELGVVAVRADARRIHMQPGQLERLNRISLKEKGLSALLDPVIGEKLRLTKRQKELLKQIEEEAERKHRYLLDHLPRVTAEGLKDLENKQKNEKATAMNAVLDERQRQEWQRLSSGH